MTITSKQMYRLSKDLIGAGNFRLWMAKQQRKLKLNKFADISESIANNCFEKSKECKKIADELHKNEVM